MIKQLIICSAILLYLVTAIPLAEEPTDNTKTANNNEESKFRLPRTTAPRMYTIEFDPDINGEDFTFSGKGTFTFEVLEPTSSVTVHKSQRIEIDNSFTELLDRKGTSQKPKSQEWNQENQFYTMEFENKLEPGTYTLKMKWNGQDSWSSPGFTRDDYYPDESEVKHLIIMVSKPLGARSIFPCWDEPVYKAFFNMSVKHPPTYTALSNTPEKSHETLPDGNIMTHFEITPKMSTFATCVAVTDDYRLLKRSKGKMSFYALEKDLDFLNFPLEISEKLLNGMESLTNISYTLPKLDQIIIPYAARGNAMDNWGIAGYQLDDAAFKNTTFIPNVEDLDTILLELSNRIAYQWFGNLVTPAWWNEAWLSESFATYYTFKILEEEDPYRALMDWLVIEYIDEYSFDAEETFDEALPIKWMPLNRTGIKNMMSPITQFKGPGVLHMLDHILGEDVFRDGVRRFLKAHQFDTVVTDDLWKALQEVYDENYGSEKPLDIKETMDPWIEQTGTPLITVTRDYETGETNITQENARYANPDNKWKIPINYATKSNPDFSQTVPTMWMEQDEETKTIPNIDKDDWIILNIQQRGFYQVNYDKENWRRLAEYLFKDREKIHPVNRAQLIHDVYRMYLNDSSYMDVLFNISFYLTEETDHLPWVPASKIISDMHEKLRNTDVEIYFQMYILFITHDITDHIGYGKDEGETPSTVRVRNMLSPLLCEYSHADCQDFAERQFNSYMANPSELAFPDSNWDWILCNGLREADDSVWDKFMSDQLPMPESIRKKKYTFIRCAESKETRDKYIAEAMSANSKATVDQINRMFSAFLENTRDDVDYAIQYFTEHFDEIAKYFEKGDDFDLSDLFNNNIMAIKTQDQYDKMTAFFEPRKNTLKKVLYERVPALQRALEESSSNIEEMKEVSDRFRQIMNYNFDLE